MPVRTQVLWSSLEIAKLLAAVLTPLSVVLFGWLISRHLKRLELAQWSNQKLIEKRLIIYDEISPILNKLYCFYVWVGYWQDISPDEVMQAKRDLDRIVNVYRHLFDDDVYVAYQQYINALFKTFNGAGEHANIRSNIRGIDGDRTVHRSYDWNPVWDNRFTTDNIATKAEVSKLYFVLMEALRSSFWGSKGTPLQN